MKKLIFAFLICAVAPFAHGAVVITSPADYATVSPKAAGLNGYNTTPANRAYTTYAPETCKTAFRKNLASAYQASGVVRLSWSEAGTVEVRRARDGKVVFATTTAARSAARGRLISRTARSGTAVRTASAARSGRAAG